MKKTLDESQFIRQSSDWGPLWIPTVLVLLVFAGYSLFSNWTQTQVQVSQLHRPFLQVSNREMSLFLWQNPEWMRVNQEKKMAYLPDFKYRGRVGVEVERAEHQASGPPELFYRYHLWKRLLAPIVFERDINWLEFGEFLSLHPEWHPEHWAAAPESYSKMVSDGEVVIALPAPVMQAFVGWKNYHKEGVAINQAEYTRSEVRAFLQDYPHFARHLWRNILRDTQESYLLSVNEEIEGVLSTNEISVFLRVALYNWRQSTQMPSRVMSTNPSS